MGRHVHAASLSCSSPPLLLDLYNSSGILRTLHFRFAFVSVSPGAMDRDEVTEFLGQVPLLQCLPGSSIRKIAGAVEPRHYEPGDYVAREGEPVDGLYFILEGQAEVSIPSNTEEVNRPDYVLKKYDYFGYGTNGPVHQVNVIALSKLTCLVLPNRFGHLLQPKTIWNADETPEKLFFVGTNIALGAIRKAPTFRQVFGGQFIGQALAAASKTVDCLKAVHSLHAIFLVVGDNNLPILYQVHRIRDGNSFATRRVEAKQKGVVIFTLIASFQKEELGFEHQVPTMPHVPPPELLPNLEEIRERRLTDPRFPMHYRNTVARKKFLPWPIEIRFCEVNNSASQHKPSLNYWFRARGKLSDDPALHSCVVAYASDLIFSGVSLNPHRQKGLKTSSLSLDHSIWFHRPVKADDWLLYAIESPAAHGGRGFSTGRMFNQRGELVASLTQEALIRKAKQPGQVPRPKL